MSGSATATARDTRHEPAPLVSCTPPAQNPTSDGFLSYGIRSIVQLKGSGDLAAADLVWSEIPPLRVNHSAVPSCSGSPTVHLGRGGGNVYEI